MEKLGREGAPWYVWVSEGHTSHKGGVLAQIPNADQLVPARADVLARATGVFSTTLGAFANFFIIMFIGLYLAAEPRLYAGGIIRLAPVNHRERTREILSEVGSTLRWWLIGKVPSMIGIGALTAGGLWLLGAPLALTLGLLVVASNIYSERRSDSRGCARCVACYPAKSDARPLRGPTLSRYSDSRKLPSDASYAKAHGFSTASCDNFRAGFAWRASGRAWACAGNTAYGSRFCLSEDVIY